MTAVFEVEHAGCPSCAKRVREAVTRLADVAEVEIDEQADTATVRLAGYPAPSEEAVNEVLLDASEGSGHAYRVLPGSWRLESRV